MDVIRLLMKQGQMLKITDVIDADTAQLIAEEFGHTVKRVAESDVEEGLFDTPDDATRRWSRVRRSSPSWATSTTARRRCSTPSARPTWSPARPAASPSTSAPTRSWRRTASKITFIDTPGHAAFTAMRARGAKVTDIVVLVVAADDGVMPQTIEAINHARAAKRADDRRDQQDRQAGRQARARRAPSCSSTRCRSKRMGGDTLEVEVSATKRINLDKLLEAIALQAEVLDLKANPDRPAEGTVIEAKLDRGRGPVATVLVQRGTLQVGDIVVAGSEWGRVRALISTTGEQVTEAGPSVPVEVLGFNGAPEAGDRVAVVENEARAREITEYRERQKRDATAARGRQRPRLARRHDEPAEDGRPQGVPAPHQGRRAGLGRGDHRRARKARHRRGRGARHPCRASAASPRSDITPGGSLRAPSIIGFNVRANKEAREAAERTGVEIRYYNIIYDLVDDMKAAMSGLLAPTLREDVLGNAAILRGVQHLQGRQGRGLPRHRRRAWSAARTCASSATTSSSTKASCRRSSASRTRSRKCRRPGMRHGLRELPGHARRRRHRVLPRRGDPPLALSRLVPRVPRPPGSDSRRRFALDSQTIAPATAVRAGPSPGQAVDRMKHQSTMCQGRPSQRSCAWANSSATP